MSNENPTNIDINGIKYIREDATPAGVPIGNRHVVVIDRGWIFAGDVEVVDDPLIGPSLRLTRAVHVRRWLEIGFDGALANPKSPKVELRAIPNVVDVPRASVVFAVKVNESWGM